jgi:hypothetical protein
MQHFYDGQIRRYLVQIIRLLSNFVVKYGDGTLVRIPVMYGDVDRQAASVLNQNSENTVLSAPRMAVYITDLELDTNRLSDASFVGKTHIRERAINELTGEYLNTQGDNYTIERLMPTPYKLTVKVDIWSVNADQKLQILEQILMLFNPSLEIQTTDNFVDWTSLSVVDLGDITFSSRTIPTGTATEIDVASLTLSTPIYISPPAKVKRLGVTTSVIASILGSIGEPAGNYIEGLGTDPLAYSQDVSKIYINGTLFTTPGNFDIDVTSGIIRLIDDRGQSVSWQALLEQFPNNYRAGLSRVYLKQPDGSNVVGYVSVNPLDDTMMVVNWDEDTYPTNTDISSDYRESGGTFDAIIDPQKTGPDSGLPAATLGVRYLVLEDIGGGLKDVFIADRPTTRINTNVLHRTVNDHKVFVDGIEVGSGSVRIPDNIDTGNYQIILDDQVPTDSEISYVLFVNEDGPDAWKNLDASDFIASANDVIEWDGTKWAVVFTAAENTNSLVYLTNFFTNTQYKWNGVGWSKSFEGEYRRGEWRLEL